ncbi:MAG: cupin domain-containing protein, partial [Rhodospirillaceae bacterium]|nr:cupin domain-containing protein [Rhodospirillaceae bacterium]
FFPGNARHETVCTSDVPLTFVYTFPCDSFDEVIYHYDD